MKSIGYFVCSNGLGHFRRALDICGSLRYDYRITIYCNSFQYDKFKFENLDNLNFEIYDDYNFRWDYYINNLDDFFNFDFFKKYSKELLKYDYVFSDNLLYVLNYRNDAIIVGSFLWEDVLHDKLKSNKFSDIGYKLLDNHNPLILCNNDVIWGSLANYRNIYDIGWVFDQYKREDTRQGLYFINTYLNYLNYSTIFNSIEFDDHYDDCVMVGRFGIGMITHCISNEIPMIGLYDESDSIEIKNNYELLGIPYNTNESVIINVNNYGNYKQKIINIL